MPENGSSRSAVRELTLPWAIQPASHPGITFGKMGHYLPENGSSFRRKWIVIPRKRINTCRKMDNYSSGKFGITPRGNGSLLSGMMGNYFPGKWIIIPLEISNHPLQNDTLFRGRGTFDPGNCLGILCRQLHCFLDAMGHPLPELSCCPELKTL